MTTPDKPPDPPHMTFEQARIVITPVAEVPTERWRPALEAFDEMVQELVPVR